MRSPWIRGGLIALASAYLLLGALSFLPDQFWLFEAISNARAELVWLGLIIALLLAFARAPATAVIIVLAAGIHGFLALHPIDPKAERASAGANLRVMSVNLGTAQKRDSRLLIQMIAVAHPDILVLVGGPLPARKMIAAALGFLPNHADNGNDDRGVSIDSRFVLANPAVESPDPVTPVLTAQVAVPTSAGETIIFFMAAHPLPPMQDWMAQHRRAGLEALAQWARSMDVPVVLAGQLNVTPQSELFGRLLRQGHLFDTARGTSPAPTWPTPVPGLGLRLDHVLVSPDIAVAKRTVGADFGSGHLPLTVDLAIPPPE